MISILPRSPNAATVASPLSVAARLLCISFVTACTNNAPHADPPARPTATTASSSSGLTVPTVNTPDGLSAVDAGVVDGAAEASDAATSDERDGGATDASPEWATRPFVADNKVLPPLESEDLTERAKKLFEAIVRDDPALGESFWFPKEPFIPLKDVKGPGKYWDNLHATYARDIHALHGKRKSWEGATFVEFKMGSTPKWVPPGDEANKIGYYRSFRGKLTYRIEEKNVTLDVHTIISWQGQWFITHLSKFKKK